MSVIERNRIIVLGAGGHAISLVDVLRSRPENEIIGFLDPDPNRFGNAVVGIPILGSDEDLPKLASKFDFFIVGVGSSGTDNRVRAEIFGRCKNLGLSPYSAISPFSIVSSSAKVGEAVQIFHASVVNAGAEIGEHAIINTSAIIEHECKIGAHAHVATGASLAGSVEVGSGAFIGCGAVVLPGIKIGENAVVGGGSVVMRNVASGSKVVGNPARLIS